MNLAVAIPTKSRYNTKTYQLFEPLGIDIFHFIEPQQIEQYEVPNKIDIKKNDGGIGYVRNFILDWGKNNKYDYIIVCDDDVQSFGIYNGKTVKKDATIWLDILNKVKDLPFEIVGINYIQHAWHEKKSISINKKFAEVCIMLNIKKINWRYRQEFNMKEDRDFALQCIKYGNGIVRFNHFWFSCPNVGTNAGGLQDEYKQKKDELAAKKMVLEWQPFITLKKKGDRIDMKTDIKKLAEHYNRYVQ